MFQMNHQPESSEIPTEECGVRKTNETSVWDGSPLHSNHTCAKTVTGWYTTLTMWI